MRVIRKADYVVMPWKNGGGTTTEIYREVQRTGGFDWRVSIATVDKDGPFSVFKGYDRHIMMLEGNGMTLDVAGEGSHHLAQLVPYSFCGERDVWGRLVAGPVTDFNLMVRRDFGTGTLRIQDCDGTQPIGGGQNVCLIHALGGDSVLLGVGETFVFPARTKAAVCEVNPGFPHAQVVEASQFPRPGS